MDKYKKKNYKLYKIEFNAMKEEALKSMDKFLELVDNLDAMLLDMYKVKYFDCLKALGTKLDAVITGQGFDVLCSKIDSKIDNNDGYYEFNDIVLKFNELAGKLKKFRYKEALVIDPDLIVWYMRTYADLYVDNYKKLPKLIENVIKEVNEK